MFSSLNAFSRPVDGTCGPDAEVDERVAILDRVAGDLGLPGGLLVDQLDLQRLAAFGEEPLRFLARPHLPLVGQIGRRQLLHLLFDRRRGLRARTDDRR